MASKAYARKVLGRHKAWSRNAHAAKARKRLQSMAGEPDWTLTGTYLIRVYAAPDGRTMEMHLHGGRRDWYRCGSERAVRGALARMMKQTTGRTSTCRRKTSN